MHDHRGVNCRPRPGRALAVGGILLTLAACGQAIVATSASAQVAAGATLAPAAASPSAVAASPSAAAGPESSVSPSPSAASAAPAGSGYPGGFLIADRGNGRLLAIDRTGRIWWRFPKAGSLPAGQLFAADDAFLAPDGLTIVANDEAHQVIDRIDIATGRVTWQYGHYDRAGSGPGYLHTPDDAYPLANGDIVVADIENCRVMEISPAKQVVNQWGTPGTARWVRPRPMAVRTATRPFPMVGSSSRRSPARGWCGSPRTGPSSSTSTSRSATPRTPS